MGNSFFQFKQFTINQENCAMKVCTDACLFGTLMYLPSKGNVLDIGTGTGLLALMAAQRSKAKIDAVEIDKGAALQAKKNFAQSAFKEQLTLITGNLNDTTLPFYKKQYDCIICNPPFYEDHLQPESEPKKIAKHTSELTYNDLLAASSKLLWQDGVLNVLLPFLYADTFIQKAKTKDFHLWTRTDIKNFQKKGPFRSVLMFGRSRKEIVKHEIAIYIVPNEYTEEARELLEPFYLKL